MTDTEARDAQTEAGRALVAWSDTDARPLDEFGYSTVAEAVRQIELEARVLARPEPERLRAAAGLLVAWLEDGGNALAYPNASGLDALRAALKAPAR